MIKKIIINDYKVFGEKIGEYSKFLDMEFNTEPNNTEYPNINIQCICGNNGSGKSSMLDFFGIINEKGRTSRGTKSGEANRIITRNPSQNIKISEGEIDITKDINFIKIYEWDNDLLLESRNKRKFIEFMKKFNIGNIKYKGIGIINKLRKSGKQDYFNELQKIINKYIEINKDGKQELFYLLGLYIYELERNKNTNHIDKNNNNLKFYKHSNDEVIFDLLEYIENSNYETKNLNNLFINYSGNEAKFSPHIYYKSGLSKSSDGKYHPFDFYPYNERLPFDYYNAENFLKIYKLMLESISTPTCGKDGFCSSCPDPFDDSIDLDEYIDTYYGDDKNYMIQTINDDIYSDKSTSREKLVKSYIYNFMGRDTKAYFEKNGKILTFEDLSSGEQSFINILFQLYSSQDTLRLAYTNDTRGIHKNIVILLDEPENSLNVSWQQKFIQNIYDIAKKYLNEVNEIGDIHGEEHQKMSVNYQSYNNTQIQFIISTHSTYIPTDLDSKYIHKLYKYDVPGLGNEYKEEDELKYFENHGCIDKEKGGTRLNKRLDQEFPNLESYGATQAEIAAYLFDLEGISGTESNNELLFVNYILQNKDKNITEIEKQIKGMKDIRRRDSFKKYFANNGNLIMKKQETQEKNKRNPDERKDNHKKSQNILVKLILKQLERYNDKNERQ